MGRDSGRCFHVLQPVVEIHMSNTVLRGVGVRVVLVFPILDLEDGGKSLLTEGDLVPSRTAHDHPLVQVELVGVDGCAHDLRQGLRRWMLAMG